MSEEAPSESREVIVMPRETNAIAELSADDIVSRLAKIEDVQRRAMKHGTDFGEVPGTRGEDGKPRHTLLKPGAEKLTVLFRLDPQFETRKIEHTDGHVTIESTCIIYHQVSGQRLGSATAECSSRESKYAWRQGQRLCPKCHKPAIIKPKAKEGKDQTWWCATFAGKDGCSANFKLNDPTITTQVVGRIINPDLPDTFPTVRRMAEKRALVAATRLVTGASAIFDEEMPEKEGGEPDPAPEPKGQPQGTPTQARPNSEQVTPDNSQQSDDDIELQAGFDAEHPVSEVPHAMGPATQEHRTKIVKLANQVHGAKSAQWLLELKKRGGNGLMDLTAIEAESVIEGLQRESMRQGVA